MLDFVVLAHDVPVDAPDGVSLDDLPGAGRLDLLSRCVLSSLLVSHGIRDDTRVHLVCQDRVTVRFNGRDVRGLHPDERSTAARVRDALQARDEAVGRQPATVAPGVTIRRGGLGPTIDSLADEGPVIQLHEDGRAAAEATPPADGTFVLSDHRDFSPEEADRLDELADERLRIGPVALHADHAITVVNNWIDTDGFDRY